MKCGERSKNFQIGDEKWMRPLHIGPTLAPEAILFESPCRARSETKIAKIICQGRDFNHLFYYS